MFWCHCHEVRDAETAVETSTNHHCLFEWLVLLDFDMMDGMRGGHAPLIGMRWVVLG